MGLDAIGDFAFIPDALRVVETAEGKPEEPGERGGATQTEISVTPETPPITLPATVLASQLRRGQQKAEVELDPGWLVALAGPDGSTGSAEPSGIEADAATDRESARTNRATRAIALTRRPHVPRARVALSLDPARTAHLQDCRPAILRCAGPGDRDDSRDSSDFLLLLARHLPVPLRRTLWPGECGAVTVADDSPRPIC